MYLISGDVAFVRSVAGYLQEISSDAEKHKDSIKSLQQAWKVFRTAPEVDITISLGQRLNNAYQATQLHKGRKSKKVTVGAVAADKQRIQEYAMYCFLLEAARLGPNLVFTKSTTESIATLASAVGHSLLVYAESSPESTPEVPKQEETTWQKTRSRLRLVQYSASLLSGVITVVGLTALTPPDPILKTQQVAGIVASTLGAIGASASVYENRDKIYGVAQTVFNRAYNLLPEREKVQSVLEKISDFEEQFFLSQG